MPLSFLVVDDFLQQPDQLRAKAMEFDYPDIKGNYPGRNSAQRIEIPGATQAASNLVGERLKPVDPLQSHGKFRITTASDPRRGAIHVDVSQWSAILYLSLPEHCRGGTEFYRHKKTGLDRSPVSDREAQTMGYASVNQVVEQTIGQDGHKRSAWEKIMDIPMRYNRLVLLRPWLFHTAGPGFGSSIQDGRLIYVMFFTLDI